MREEKLLSMSAFEAAHLIRSFRIKNPHVENPDLIKTARAIRADFFPHDYEAGIVLEAYIDLSVAHAEIEIFFTRAIDEIIDRLDPFWARLAPSGRSHVLHAIGVNGAQCLRSAGLLTTDRRATDWWDSLSSKRRQSKDEQLLAQGRKGERLSLAYEVNRLSQEGIDRSPIWVALDDNTVGYDILSHSSHGGNVTNRLIEVKTTVNDEPRMFLTRNEWSSALRFGSAFEFHVWSFPSENLHIFSVEDVKPHVPSDQGVGRWQNVEITFAS